MKNSILKKENGVVEAIMADASVIESKEFGQELRDTVPHLCFNCENCSPLTCKKIKDEVKSTIDGYDFIGNGLQVYDHRGDLLYFYVSTCDNFIKDQERKKKTNKEEIKALNRIKESIKIAYFDATDIDDADNKHLYQLERGLLTFDKPRELIKK